MSVNPRSLPPAHKNQLFVPVKCIGFLDNQPSPTGNLFRNYEIGRKKVRPKPAGVFSPSGFTNTPEETEESRETTSSKDSMTSLIHVRGRASANDVTESARVDDVKGASPTSEDGDGDDAKVTPFLTEDPGRFGSRAGRRRSAGCPALECSKYTVIGEPRFRKQRRAQGSLWTLPRIGQPDDVHHHHHHHPKTNSIDLRSIYGAKSKVQQVIFIFL